jgi:hypothetical protein
MGIDLFLPSTLSLTTIITTLKPLFIVIILNPSWIALQHPTDGG